MALRLMGKMPMLRRTSYGVTTNGPDGCHPLPPILAGVFLARILTERSGKEYKPSAPKIGLLG